MAKSKVTNTAPGPRGAYLDGVLVMAEPGQTIEADDFEEEWFAREMTRAAKDAKDEQKD